jgi:Ankyrin repeats (3 copies)/Ankyrin repeats (many copies)
MCGPTEIDGYAFCLGIDSLKEFFESHAELQSLIRSVTYLIRGAIFRTGGLPQAICTLGELIDMYHNREATLLHDKVYALLAISGMNSEDLRNAKLLPNYRDVWEELLQRLAKFLLCDKISVETWSGKEIAVIKSKGCILGRISSVQNIISLDGRQGVDIIFKDISGQLGYKKEWSAHWTLQPTAKPIRDGDLICLLQGASKPTIIRLRKDHFVIIMIAASPLENGQTESEYIQWPKLFARDFLLVWDWKNSLKSQDLGEYDALVWKIDWVLEYSKTKEGGDLNKAARIWNVVMILDDVEEYEKAEERLREAIAGFEIAFEKKHLHLPKGQHGRTPLSWAAGNGHEAVVKLLLEHQAVAEWKGKEDGRTPLSYAAENGHEALVKLLLEHQAVVDSKDVYDRRTPLSYAAENGHKAVVKLLLEHQAVVDSNDVYGETPLSYAARNGHEAVVKLLRETFN